MIRATARTEPRRAALTNNIALRVRIEKEHAIPLTRKKKHSNYAEYLL